MATYTLTIDLTGFEYPLTFAELIRQRCSIDLGFSGNLDIESIASQSAVEIENLIPDSTCTYVIIDNTIVFTLITTAILTPTECGNVVGLRLFDDETTYIESWIEAILCPNCQDVAVNNCGAVEISLPLPDDDYTVTIYDNQSGVSYTQNVQWTSGTGTWNSTNTAGVFTPFSIYTLTVTDSEGQPVSWPVGPDEYTCARVTFSATVDTNVDD